MPLITNSKPVGRAPAPAPRPTHDPDFCAQRGFHGPLIRAEVYATVPGWEGMGDCAACGTTIRIPTPVDRDVPATGVAAESSPPTPHPPT